MNHLKQFNMYSSLVTASLSRVEPVRFFGTRHAFRYFSTSRSNNAPENDADAHVSIVQGGSRGIGLEFVRQLLTRPEAGGGRGSGHVVATCRDPSPEGAPKLHELSTQFPGRLTILPVDVTRPETIQALAEEVRVRLGRVDLLLNVAGVLHTPDGSMFPETALSKVKAENMLLSYQVNAVGPLLMTQAFAPLLQSTAAKIQNDPWLVMVANVSARVSSIGDNRLGGWYSYRASKTALNQLTKNCTIEFGRKKHPVTCILLHPGTVATDLSQPFQKNVPKEKLFTTEKSVSHLLEVIQKTEIEDTGILFAWDGEKVPW